MAGLKCFTALNAFLLLSLLAASLSSLPASAVEQLGGIVGDAASFDVEVASGIGGSVDSSSGLFRRLLEKNGDDGNKDDKKKKDKKKKKKDNNGDDKVIKKKKSKKESDDNKGKYEKKVTDKKKKKNDEKKKKTKKPVIKKKKLPPPPQKKKKPVKTPAPKPKAPTPKPKPPTPKPTGSPRVPISYSGSGNPIDNCWLRSDWKSDRKRLASCAIGFGADAIGGRDGEFYVVTDAGDDATNPAYGTLRWGLVQLRPLWITFAHDMTITPKAELIFTSYKTVDGRGAKVVIGNGAACFTLQNVQHIIIENIEFYRCSPSGGGRVISSTVHTGYRNGADGDGVSVFNGQHIWVDHCTLSRGADGLIDCIHGSDAITISNNYFSDHDKVMLFGHSDAYTQDKNMKITVAYNTFGPNLVQRMPRCRHGQFHVINNDYGFGWGIYAIGGSGDPTIMSEGNYFDARGGSKQVTKRETGGGNSWSWHSHNDVLVNGAYFVDSGGYDTGVLKTSSAGTAQFWSPALTKRSGRLSL